MFGWKSKPVQVERTASIELLDKAIANSRMTPDIPWLETKHSQRVFVPDQLMRDHRQNDLIMEHGVYGAIGFTNERFTLWKRKLKQNSFAIPLRIYYTGVPLARIKGEIWALLPYQLMELDKYYNQNLDIMNPYGVLLTPFIRRRVSITIPYHQELLVKNTQTGMEYVKPTGTIYDVMDCWIYLGNPLYWPTHLDAGLTFDPVRRYRHRESRIGEYYHWTKQEYFHI